MDVVAHRRLAGGFTLIELMVVIAMIAILAALLLPALARAKAAGLSAVCKNNERQIGLAIRMYVDDHRGYPPRGIPFWSTWWDVSTLPYTSSNRGIFFCPAVTNRKLRWTNLFKPNHCYGYNDIGTGVNRDGLQLGLASDLAVDPSGAPSMITEDRVKCPSDMIMVGDYPAEFGWGQWRWVIDQDGDITPDLSDSTDWVDNRHSGGGNVVFCDSHIEYAQQKKWIELTEACRKRWNNDNLPHRETWR